VHNPPDFLLLSGLLPKLLGARLVFDVHDLTSDLFDLRYGARRGARQLDRVLRFFERSAYSLADDILTVHEPYRRELVARGASPERVTVVMNTVAADLLPPAAPPVAGGPFRVVYHGTITPHYGVDLLVRAVARARDRIPDVRLDVFGSGDALAASVRTVERLGLSDRARFVDSLSRRDVLAAVNGASVGVVPSLPTRHNTLAVSTKLFEYVALRIPAVVADLPTSRMHFADDEMLYFRAGDEVALANALVAVAHDPDAARARADAALRRYEAYKWERNAERYVEVLSRGIGRTLRPTHA
jgi:glycosyltransferase involved in cell wall biosynthesis